MIRYRASLPQLSGDPFLTDGGIETTLIFHEGIDLPDFAAFTLLRSDAGRAALRRYFRPYLDLAFQHDTGLILESATWRANPDWTRRLGYSRREFAQVNVAAITMLAEIRGGMRHSRPVLVSGCVGPRGDGYVPSSVMTCAEADEYHREQVGVFAATDADMVCAMTMNYAAEAIGVARAACDFAIPVAISFTVETDGALPTGQSLADAIRQVDNATGGYPSYYMINCAHPEHFARVLQAPGPWDRIRGLRANASHLSHAELNDSTGLDVGSPAELADCYLRLRSTLLPRLNIFGGCCGTDHRHVGAIAASCVPLFQPVSEVA